ncbi:MAG: hypothetical protein D6706_12900 [Chloroflexi bacterium]|nr:MAG: hypothetical protein D6706_12900 [Chloroflexota bacterium]
MAQIKNYGLAGVSSGLQFGKGGGQLSWNTDHFAVTTDGTTLTSLRVLTTPVHANDAASKAYVDSISQGLDLKPSVRVATTAAGNLATDFANGSVVDGVTLATGDRILIKNQANPAENGIYIVNATGAPTRAPDADNVGDLSGGSFTFVEEGTTNGDTGWVVSSNGTLTPGTDAINWTQFSSAGVAQAGVGLTKNGNVFDVNVGASTITVDGSDNLIVNSNATAGQPLLSAGAAGTEAAYGALDLTLATSTTGLLPKNRGGLATDVSGYGVGSLFVNAAAGVTELAVGTDGNALVMVAGSPAWGRVNLADATNSVTGVLGTANGGTGQTAYTQGEILIGNTTGGLDKLPLGTADQVLTSNGVTAAWSNVPVANGSVQALTVDANLAAGPSAQLGPIPANAEVLEVRVHVITAWDDPAATITVGTTTLPTDLMVSTENDPATIGTYVKTLYKQYPGGEILHAFMNHGTATTGSAKVVVTYVNR